MHYWLHSNRNHLLSLFVLIDRLHQLYIDNSVRRLQCLSEPCSVRWEVRLCFWVLPQWAHLLGLFGSHTRVYHLLLIEHLYSL